MIILEKVKVIDYCYDPIPASNENFNLFNYWSIFSVQTTDTILYAPCEVRYMPNIYFSQDVYEDENNELSYNFSKSSGNNDYGGSYIIKGDSLLLKPKLFTFGYYASTEAVFNWEDKFNNSIRSSCDSCFIHFSINTNILTIRNPKDSSVLTLFTN